MKAVREGLKQSRTDSLVSSAASNLPAVICFTSGSTGPVKGVTLSQAALHAQSEAKIARLDYAASDVYLHTAPMFHVGGLSSALAMLHVGACQILTPKFSPTQAVSDIVRHGATSLIAVPAALHDLVRAAEAASCSLSTVRMLLIGGGAPSPALELSARKAFPAARMTLAYGMTEAASSISFQDLPLPSASAAPSSPTSASAPAQGSMSARAPGSTSTIEPQHTCVGLPAQKSVIVVQPDSRLQNQSTSNMQLGEVVIRGPSMMLGYWNNPAANVVAFLPGGGFRTGDIGFLDAQGRLWLAGRLKNLIRSGTAAGASDDGTRQDLWPPSAAAASTAPSAATSCQAVIQGATRICLAKEDLLLPRSHAAYRSRTGDAERPFKHGGGWPVRWRWPWFTASCMLNWQTRE
ncbi:hypothetical protein WJX84_003504 [Apatococcus fuscideae]|uniref:AMP-dependent synthetase/ligase domain-containing protein n=1 Tax=Apatococcus fuscideae TaxID=2026836 RepID=A0AAW1RK75_9CHLO